MKILEKTIAYSPPLLYSKIDGIKSIDGTEAEGWLISIGGTPKEMMSRSPEFTYKRLIAASKMAKNFGAETIVLALEGRFEKFTIGRDIKWENVKEIYKLGLKHGMKLAAISGLNGVYTDDDINKIRRLALKARRDNLN